MRAKDKTDTDLFLPMQLGSLTLANRIVMAPLTRSRAGVGDVQGAMNAEYYAQRASAGLIISEATQISPQGKGYAFTPGIYSEQQTAGWKLVTEAVHQQGGLIFAQLWHVGRISHPDLQPDNQFPVAPSAIKPLGKAFTETGFKDFVTPRALALDELPGIIEQYVHAARCAQKAGFDGIEIHAANGYLLEQFLSDKTNKRTDGYGGSIENRARLLLEVVEALTGVWPAERVGIRLSPVSHANDIDDSTPMETFSYVVQQLNHFGLSYIHCVEGETIGPRNIPDNFSFAALRALYKGIYMANNGYDLELALSARANNLADLICFGRPFIANPDLVARLKTGAKLVEAPRETWYGNGAKGYTDWPSLS
ncbi:alkene reductase [Legionella worsleiensis]|uniref:NADH-dependent flavin oxidoreductase, Oye family n=1 Tax=Legionella worsleiensis TaxID=45076 RepID=A0A0W1AKH1_9GAMM|nr:alkene reductase [Legionella worsleiensis]KTD81672.1 NADH-dependent flavin oxidoreductase, Oye family [Legionella worsleiensis]STY31918.1 NADH-dependent flavin oxidoreductase, Oye family [Legionella worsleiensis]